MMDRNSDTEASEEEQLRLELQQLQKQKQLGEGYDEKHEVSLLSQLGVLLLRGKDESCMKEAEKLLLYVVKRREKLLGLSHPSTLTSLYHMSLLLEWMGEFEDAVLAMRIVCERRESVLGAEHVSTQLSVNEWKRLIMVEANAKASEV